MLSYPVIYLFIFITENYLCYLKAVKVKISIELLFSSITLKYNREMRITLFTPDTCCPEDICKKNLRRNVCLYYTKILFVTQGKLRSFLIRNRERIYFDLWLLECL